MNKKKKIIISIISVTLIIFLVIGITYAYFNFITNSGTTQATAGKLDIDYNISDEELEGFFVPSATRSGGIMEAVTAKLNTGSVSGKLNIYITPTQIEGIPSSAINWEVDVVDTSSNILNHYSGTFSSATIDTPIKIVDGYTLTTNLLTFNVYVWLNGALITNSNFDSDNSFAATISADSVPITGQFE